MLMAAAAPARVKAGPCPIARRGSPTIDRWAPGRRPPMREIEFLPPWYAQFLRRRRTVFFQTWVTIGVLLGLGLWIFLADRNQRNAESVLDTLRGQLQQT